MHRENHALNRRAFLKLMAGSLAVAGMGGTGNVFAAESGFAAIPKSLWVWRTPLSEAAEVKNIVRKYNFRTVFYSIPPAERPGLFAGRSPETSVVHAFRDAGVRFYAVLGDAAWTRHPQQLPRAVEAMLNFQAHTRLLDGLCLDIEPQALPEWKSSGGVPGGETSAPPHRLDAFGRFGAGHARHANAMDRPRVQTSGGREEIIAHYLQLLDTISGATSSDGISLAAAVAPFYANNAAPGGRSMLEVTADHVGETIIMAYRNSPDAALRISRKSLRQLDSAGKRWWFGVSTFQRAKSADVSYAGATFDQFSTAMVDLDQSLSGSNRSFYQGIAINDYPSLTAILRA